MDNDSPYRLLLFVQLPEIAQKLQRYLRAHHYQVDVAYDDCDVLRLALRSKPDLILLGIASNGGGVTAILSALRAETRTNYIPVMLLAEDQADHRLQMLTALQLGADDYIRQPVDYEELHLRIKNKIGFTRRQRASINPTEPVKPRLLIVEDDPDIGNMIRIFFSAQDYYVTLTDKGLPAFELACKGKPDAIILDIMLPDTDGYTICKQLRSAEPTRSIPILFLTQRDERSDRLRGLELGADDYLTKPFDIEELKFRVGRILKSQQVTFPGQKAATAPPAIEKPAPIKILFLAANPSDTPQLRLDAEMRAIDQALQKAEFRHRFEIKQQWAVQIGDLQNHLLRHKPDIVHFSGHGSQTNEIILENSHGHSRAVSVRALSQLFAVLKDNIRCVVLNACYAEAQAQAIAESIGCVVGMARGIDDQTAIGFAAAFYQAIGFGRDVQTAFDLGCVQLELEGEEDQDVPRLLVQQVDPRQVVFVKGNS
ncbi:MAG: response regulator [Chloroflexota bacterium]